MQGTNEMDQMSEENGVINTNEFIKPEWNKHVEEFGNTIFFALEAICAKMADVKNGYGPEVILARTIFNSIVLQGEDYTMQFLREFKKINNLKVLWLSELCPKTDKN